MKTGASLKNRQGGAVAVVVGISIVLLVGFLAMVVDLGHAYIARTELQNGADAAALAGAKQLNGTLLGVNDTSTNNGAVQWAIAAAAKNNYDFSSKPVDITIADIWVGNCPDDICMVAASSITTDAAAADKTFLKVHTRNRDMPTWFASIWNIFNVSTYGMAVAGRTKLDITPIALCAVDVRQCPCLPGESNCGQGSLRCGYEPGKSYHVAGINPIGPGTPIWIDPVATSAATCDTTNTRDNRPFICKGEAFVSITPGSFIYTNTGGSIGPLYAALDSRFGDYASAGKCDAASAPPDGNVQEYAYQLFADVFPAISGQNPYKKQNLPGQNIIPDWMAPSPNPNPSSTEYPQTSLCTVTGTDQYGANIYNCPWSQNGVYWSASRPVPPTPGVTTNSNYPATGTPYSLTSGRRLLNLLIVQCEAAGGVCRPAKNRMVGQFLLQTRASVSNDVNLEFTRTVSQSEILAEIKLFH